MARGDERRRPMCQMNIRSFFTGRRAQVERNEADLNRDQLSTATTDEFGVSLIRSSLNRDSQQQEDVSPEGTELPSSKASAKRRPPPQDPIDLEDTPSIHKRHTESSTDFYTPSTSTGATLPVTSATATPSGNAEDPVDLTEDTPPKKKAESMCLDKNALRTASGAATSLIGAATSRIGLKQKDTPRLECMSLIHAGDLGIALGKTALDGQDAWAVTSASEGTLGHHFGLRLGDVFVDTNKCGEAFPMTKEQVMLVSNSTRPTNFFVLRPPSPMDSLQAQNATSFQTEVGLTVPPSNRKAWPPPSSDTPPGASDHRDHESTASEEVSSKNDESDCVADSDEASSDDDCSDCQLCHSEDHESGDDVESVSTVPTKSTGKTDKNKTAQTKPGKGKGRVKKALAKAKKAISKGVKAATKTKSGSMVGQASSSGTATDVANLNESRGGDEDSRSEDEAEKTRRKLKRLDKPNLKFKAREHGIKRVEGGEQKRKSRLTEELIPAILANDDVDRELKALGREDLRDLAKAHGLSLHKNRKIKDKTKLIADLKKKIKDGDVRLREDLRQKHESRNLTACSTTHASCEHSGCTKKKLSGQKFCTQHSVTVCEITGCLNAALLGGLCQTHRKPQCAFPECKTPCRVGMGGHCQKHHQCGEKLEIPEPNPGELGFYETQAKQGMIRSAAKRVFGIRDDDVDGARKTFKDNHKEHIQDKKVRHGNNSRRYWNLEEDRNWIYEEYEKLHLKEPLECSECGEVKNPIEFPTANNVKHALMTKCWDCKNLNRKQNTHGLNVKQQKALLEHQGNKCGVCEIEMRSINEGRRSCIDHNQDNGQVNEFLCDPCNKCLPNRSAWKSPIPGFDVEMFLERAIPHVKSMKESGCASELQCVRDSEEPYMRTYRERAEKEGTLPKPKDGERNFCEKKARHAMIREEARKALSREEQRKLCKRDHKETYYGLTIPQREAILEYQEHKCPICESKMESIDEGHETSFDHNHDSGDLNLHLCNTCNICLYNDSVWDKWVPGLTLLKWLEKALECVRKMKKRGCASELEFVKVLEDPWMKSLREHMEKMHVSETRDDEGEE